MNALMTHPTRYLLHTLLMELQRKAYIELLYADTTYKPLPYTFVTYAESLYYFTAYKTQLTCKQNSVVTDHQESSFIGTMNALQSSFQLIIACDAFTSSKMMLVEPTSSFKSTEEIQLYDCGIAAGADDNLLFLFSLHFNYTEESPVAEGQSRGRVE